MLTENAQTQAAFEALADAIISNYGTHATQVVMSGAENYNPLWDGEEYIVTGDSFGGTRFEAMAPSFKGNAALSPLKLFIKENPYLDVRLRASQGAGRMGGQVNGHYQTRRAGDYVSKGIVLFTHSDYPEIAAAALAGKAFEVKIGIEQILKERRSTLVHELVHAYDDWISKGKYRVNKRSIAADMASATLNKYSDAQDKEVAYASYLNNPVEINARFAQRVSEIRMIRGRSWKDYYSEFQWGFAGWKNLPKADKERLTKRLVVIWARGRTSQRKDITGLIWRLETQIAETYGVHLHMDSYGETGAIRVERIEPGKMTKRQEALIIDRITLFADMWNRTIALGEGVFSKPLLTHYDFVPNKGNKRNFQFSTAYYRISRRGG